jgi:iron complex outermembrane receptor protein
MIERAERRLIPRLMAAAAALLLTATMAPVKAWAADAASDTADGKSVEDLRQLSIEELANLKVTSVAKRAEPISQAPASVFVITAEDIRRSGATSLPEALRLAPNLEVAQINGYYYAITARGFNSFEAANKLLVLIDGRSLYSPVHSGVFWENIDLVMADVERIEVVSGPGGTLWGGNTVNGVINVITRQSSDSQGPLLETIVGDHERSGTVRFGGKIGEAATFRVYATSFERGELPKSPGDATSDAFRGAQGGFRIDRVAGDDSFTLQGDAYANSVETLGGEELSGANVTGRWTRQLGERGSVTVQAYYDKFRRSQEGLYSDTLDTWDAQIQHNFALGDRHQVVWGAGVRHWRDDFPIAGPFNFMQAKKNLDLADVFAQDEIALTPSLKLTAGLKVEQNNYSGVDWLPNVRLAWQADERTLLWSAVSRSVRTPNRIERDLQGLGILAPSPDFHSETVVAYELGYRGRPTADTTLSVTGFYNRYDGLRTDATTGGGFPLVFENGLKAQTYGVEAWGSWSVRPWWLLKAGVNTLKRDFQLEAGHVDLTDYQEAGTDPNYQAQLRSQMNLSRAWELDLALRSVGAVHEPRTGAELVKSYVEADARVGWRVREGLALSLAGFNLLNPRHLEINDVSTAALRTVPRTVYLSLRWGF